MGFQLTPQAAFLISLVTHDLYNSLVFNFNLPLPLASAAGNRRSGGGQQSNELAIEESARWFAEIVPALSGEGTAEVISESFESSAIQPDDIERMTTTHPTFAVVDMKSDLFVATFLSHLPAGFSLEGKELHMTMATLAAAGLSTQTLRTLTQLLTKRTMVLLVDKQVNRERVKAGIMAAGLLHRKMLIAVSSSDSKTWIEQIIANLRQEMPTAVPDVQDVQLVEHGDGSFTGPRGKQIFHAESFEHRTKVSLEDVAFLCSDSITIESGGRSVLIVRLTELLPIARLLSADLIPALVRAILSQA